MHIRKALNLSAVFDSDGIENFSMKSQTICSGQNIKKDLEKLILSSILRVPKNIPGAFQSIYFRSLGFPTKSLV